MKKLRLVLASLAVVAVASWAVYAIACDKNKTSATNASAASATGCPYAGEKANLVQADASGGCPMHATTASAGSACSAHGTSATAAGSGCSAHDTKGTGAAKATFVTASKDGKAGGDACCMGKDAKSTSASNQACPHGSRAGGGAMTGVMACNGQGMTAAMCEGMNGKCDACADMANSDSELMQDGTDMQAVPIKNGVMFIYTASKPGQVSAIQSVMARRTDHLNKLVSAGDRAKLCPECRTMRGAMASGKVTREVVNIEGGALTLLTSNDPAMVKKIRAIADQARSAMATRAKS